jgi:Fur family transcriptional regulator, ferric uptake regulator
MDSQYFKDLLHDRNLKATSPRLNLLIKMQEHESAMPYSAIQKAMKSIDRVTLYRTLESLKGQGVIHKAFQENNEIYYAICGKKCGKNHHNHDHIHFKCVRCESVTCEKPRRNMEISIPDNEIHKISIYVEGVCKLCKD